MEVSNKKNNWLRFAIDWKNIKEETLESKEVYTLNDYNEDSVLFI